MPQTFFAERKPGGFDVIHYLLSIPLSLIFIQHCPIMEIGQGVGVMGRVIQLQSLSL